MRLFAALCGALLLCGAAPADVIWIELTQGDLSDDRFSPTPLTVAPGDNELFGVITGDDMEGNLDRDYFSMTIPAGHQLSELWLTDYFSEDFAAFIGVQPGPIFPDDPAFVAPEDLLGWTLFGESQLGQDLLPQMGVNGQTFTPPLPEGTYSFWVQQTGLYTNWAANFVITEVPEPAGGLILLGGLALLRRR